MKERIEVLLSAEQIDRRMAELADELYQEFGDEQVELVCALKGAVVTIVDLAKKMKMPRKRLKTVSQVLFPLRMK